MGRARGEISIVLKLTRNWKNNNNKCCCNAALWRALTLSVVRVPRSVCVILCYDESFEAQLNTLHNNVLHASWKLQMKYTSFERSSGRKRARRPRSTNNLLTQQKKANAFVTSAALCRLTARRLQHPPHLHLDLTDLYCACMGLWVCALCTI